MKIIKSLYNKQHEKVFPLILFLVFLLNKKNKNRLFHDGLLLINTNNNKFESFYIQS